MTKLKRVVSAVLVAIFGRWNWQLPAWLEWLSAKVTRAWRALVAKPARAIAAALIVLLSGAALAWYVTRPKPHYVTYVVTPPGLTEYNDNGISSIKPMTVVFADPAAPLKDLQKAVTAGIDLSPALAGTWMWKTDKELQFTPKDDWPVDGAFSVKLAKTAIAPQATLVRYTFRFKSQPFAAAIAEGQFYQDPRDPNLKKLVATIRFSHPVDTAQLESHISLITAKDAEYLGLGLGSSVSRNFTVVYDKFKLAAYVHSAALKLTRDDTPMVLRVDRGVRASRGGNDSPVRLETAVTIPGRASLRFSDARMTIVDNARYEPEQILLLTSSSPVAERALGGNVSARLLPERHPKQPKEDKRPFDWRSNDAQIDNDILAQAKPLDLAYVASDDAGNTSHGFKFVAPVGRYLYVVVKDNVQGIGGYISGKPYGATVRVEPYEPALTFLGQGSLLSLSSDKQVGFLVRDVDKVDVEIARVLPNQLQHLTPQMWNFSRPNLYGDFEDRLVERFTTRRSYVGKAPGKPTYDSVDLTQYLQDKNQKRRGLFLLHLRAVEQPRRDDDYGYRRRGYERVEDTRLILVTDLGFIVKAAKDGSRDVFVQSVRTGLPIEGAEVELLGKNGEPAQAATTDVGGRAQLANTNRLQREKTPAAIIVQKDGDVSLLPIQSGDRGLNLSRFDTGGVENAASAQQVSAYLFSDRGIYRPGETTHLGMIARTADWKGALAGLPVVVEITDARGLVVHRSDIKLSAAGFDEVLFTTQPTSPTGIYQVTAYLPRNERRRDTLGSTSFKVQEFEPDRMKVRLELTDKPDVAQGGWLRPDDVKAAITVAHLFGEPAGNRRVEGELSLTPVLPRFSKYADYRFQIGEALNEPYQEKLAAKTTDAAGHAEFTLDLKRFVGRAYRLNLLARAFEAEGGRNVAAQTSAIVSDAPYLVGVKPDGDLSFVQRNAVRASTWLAVNQQLVLVAADTLTLEWVQRKYVSVLTEQNDKTVKYVSRLKEVVRDSKPATIATGGSDFMLPTSEPGDFALVLRDASGAELNKLTYTVAGSANLSRSLERDTELQVQLDKPAYSGGETIEVSIRAPYVGAGLITVERERVFQYQWFKTTTTSSVQKITLPPTFEGNGYVSVQFLRDPSSDELFLSPLSYGVAAFAPNLSSRTEGVKLDVPREAKPGATLAIKVTPDEASRAAVLAVDEGILQVARYKNPDPLGFFFQKRMLEVDTKQILDLILPDFKRFLALAAPGGDADGGYARQLNPFNKKHKPPVAYWSGLVDVGPKGRELRYTVPDYFTGKLRIVAIAVSAKHMGVAEAGIDVKGDFILTPNVPTMAAPGDEFVVSVGVFNNASGTNPGTVKLQASVGPELTVVGPSSVDLQIADKSEGVGEFRVKANATLGPASLKFVAKRGTAEAQLEESVSVRPAVAFRTTLTLGRVDNTTAVASLTRDLFGEKRKVEAAVSTLPLVWGQGLTAYLDGYEYACTEQLVSKGFAALILTVRTEFGVIRSRGAQSPLDTTYSVLRGRANDEGGFGLWSASPETAEFATIYAAHLMVEAKERGQNVPNDLLNNVNDWLTKFASTPASTLDAGRMRAYAVYLLVRQGIKPNAALANVEQELTQRYAKTWTADLAAAYLASTYRLMQRNADADRLIKGVPWSVRKNDLTDNIYYGAAVHDAQLLYLIARHFPAQVVSAPPAALEAMTAVSGNNATSLSAAYTLLALDAYSKTAAADEALAITEIAKNGQTRDLTLPTGVMPKVSVSRTATQLRFSKQGQAAAYYAINESGFDRNPPQAPINQEIEIYRDFVDAKGRVLQRVTVGDEFFVRLRLRTTKRDVVSQVALVDLLPGGIEPVLEVQAAVGDTSDAGVDPAQLRKRAAAKALPLGLPDRSDWFPQHIDVRDDRVLLYGDATKTAGTFVYRVRATNAGTYQVPPAFAEGMYNRSITGQSAAGTLQVVKP